MVTINKNKIRELMAKKNIATFQDLAKCLGISKTQLSNILSDKFTPIKSNVVEIAEFFDIDPLKIIEVKKKEK